MLDPRFVFLGAAIGLVGSGRYAVATLRGRSKPNRVTWLLWAAAPMIGFFAQLDSGVGLPSVLTLSAGVGPLMVLAASLLNRRSVARLTAFDFACGAVAAIAVVVWLALGDAPLAVLFAVAADAVGAVPTVRKAWRDPGSENTVFYVLIGVNAAITLLTLTDWSPQNGAFAAYMIALSLTLITVITARRSSRRRQLDHGAELAARRAGFGTSRRPG